MINIEQTYTYETMAGSNHLIYFSLEGPYITNNILYIPITGIESQSPDGNSIVYYAGRCGYNIQIDGETFSSGFVSTTTTTSATDSNVIGKPLEFELDPSYPVYMEKEINIYITPVCTVAGEEKLDGDSTCLTIHPLSFNYADKQAYITMSKEANSSNIILKQLGGYTEVFPYMSAHDGAQEEPITINDTQVYDVRQDMEIVVRHKETGEVLETVTEVGVVADQDVYLFLTQLAESYAPSELPITVYASMNLYHITYDGTEVNKTDSMSAYPCEGYGEFTLNKAEVSYRVWINLEGIGFVEADKMYFIKNNNTIPVAEDFVIPTSITGIS